MTDNTDATYYDQVMELVSIANNAKTDTDIKPFEDFFISHPGKAEPYFLLALYSYRLSDLPRAIAFTEQAHKRDPQRMEYVDTLACLYTYMGRLSEGLYYAKLATTCEPHEEVDLLPKELSEYFKALEHTKPSPHYLKALQAFNLLDFKKASEECSKELIINPDHIDCLYLHCQSAQHMGDYSLVLENVKKAERILKNKPISRFQLLKGNIEIKLGLIEDAITSFQRALQDIDPNESSLIDTTSSILELVQYLPPRYSEESKKFFQIFTDAINDECKSNDRPLPDITDRKISIGYISDKLYSCEDGHIISTLLSSHDQNKFKICVYQKNIREDFLTQKLQSNANTWVRIHDLDDDVLDIILKNDELDILVDLTGFSQNRNSLALARHPASIQIAWFTYPNKTNTNDFEYYIGGENTATVDEHQNSGTSIAFPYGPFPVSPPVFIESNEKTAFETNGYITFASEIALSRLTNEHIKVWQETLKTNKNSKLILLNAEPITPILLDRINELINISGLSEHTTVQHLPSDELELNELFGKIDINLSIYNNTRPLPFAYAATTGIPLISLKGVRRQERIAASLTYALGRKEWVASNVEEFVEIIKDLTSNPSNFKKERKRLEDEVKTLPIFNTHKYVSMIENLYMNLLERKTNELT